MSLQMGSVTVIISVNAAANQIVSAPMQTAWLGSFRPTWQTLNAPSHGRARRHFFCTRSWRCMANGGEIHRTPDPLLHTRSQRSTRVSLPKSGCWWSASNFSVIGE
ncbi:unnamed protein product [Cercospora beticola]|nr:unnamed protein product [Cercospora beticola]